MKTQAPFRTAVAVAVVALVGLGVAARPAESQAKPRTIEIVGSDDMQYSVKVINAKPGESLRIVLKTVSALPKEAMSHNFILLSTGTDVNAFAMAAITARATEYVPASKKTSILANTKLAGGGETVEVTFTAPTTAGTYDYICSFPGHVAAGMRGQLIVK